MSGYNGIKENGDLEILVKEGTNTPFHGLSRSHMNVKFSKKAKNGSAQTQVKRLITHEE